MQKCAAPDNLERAHPWDICAPKIGAMLLISKSVARRFSSTPTFLNLKVMGVGYLLEGAATPERLSALMDRHASILPRIAGFTLGCLYPSEESKNVFCSVLRELTGLKRLTVSEHWSDCYEKLFRRPQFQAPDSLLELVDLCKRRGRWDSTVSYPSYFSRSDFRTRARVSVSRSSPGHTAALLEMFTSEVATGMDAVEDAVLSDVTCLHLPPNEFGEWPGLPQVALPRLGRVRWYDRDQSRLSRVGRFPLLRHAEVWLANFGLLGEEEEGEGSGGEAVRAGGEGREPYEAFLKNLVQSFPRLETVGLVSDLPECVDLRCLARAPCLSGLTLSSFLSCKVSHLVELLAHSRLRSVSLLAITAPPDLPSPQESTEVVTLPFLEELSLYVQSEEYSTAMLKGLIFAPNLKYLHLDFHCDSSGLTEDTALSLCRLQRLEHLKFSWFKDSWTNKLWGRYVTELGSLPCLHTLEGVLDRLPCACFDAIHSLTGLRALKISRDLDQPAWENLLPYIAFLAAQRSLVELVLECVFPAACLRSLIGLLHCSHIRSLTLTLEGPVDASQWLPVGFPLQHFMVIVQRSHRVSGDKNEESTVDIGRLECLELVGALAERFPNIKSLCVVPSITYV